MNVTAPARRVVSRDPGILEVIPEPRGPFMRDGVRLDRREAALVVVDVRERLFGAMEPEQRDAMVRNLRILGAVARRLDTPILVTEQYPKGLGHTLPEVREALGSVEPLSTPSSLAAGERRGLGTTPAISRWSGPTVSRARSPSIRSGSWPTTWILATEWWAA